MWEHFNAKQFFNYILLIIFTVSMSFVLHELGHYLSAKMLGYQPTLHYNKVSFENDLNFENLAKNTSVEVKSKIQRDKIIWNIAGPIITILLGTIGLVLLLIKHSKKDFFNNFSIFYFLLSLNWLRQIIALLQSLISLIIGRKSHSDDLVIDYILQLPPLTFSLITGILSFFIFSFTIFKLIPITHRLTIFLSVAVGGSIGSILWLFIIGPILLP